MLFRSAATPASKTGFALIAALAVAVLGQPHTALAQSPSVAPAMPATTACPVLLQHSFNRLQDQKPQALCQYAGRVVLVVNTASFCGFTPQYRGLEALYAKYAAQGLVVLGFPSNDFGQQEPGNAQQIAETCFNTYAVKFPMFSKTTVKGAQANLFYQQLSKATGQQPGWNFHKYLIDRRGLVVTSFVSDVAPNDAQLVAAVGKALAQR